MTEITHSLHRQLQLTKKISSHSLDHSMQLSSLHQALKVSGSWAIKFAKSPFWSFVSKTMPKSGQNNQNGDFANFIAHEPLTFSSWCKGESCIEWSKLCDDIFFVSWSCLCREWVISVISLWNFYWLRFSSNSLSHREPFVENLIHYKTSL